MNSNQLRPFCFGDNLVRVIEDENGDPWFVAKDVCKILELGNPRSSVALLDDDEKGVHTIDTPGGRQEMSIISESGLYALVFRSRKPEAKSFSKWVRSEVLPAIRKTGRYEMPGARSSVLSDYVADFMGRFSGYATKMSIAAKFVGEEMGITDGSTLAKIFDLYAEAMLGQKNLQPSPVPREAQRIIQNDMDKYTLSKLKDEYQRAKFFVQLCEELGEAVKKQDGSNKQAFRNHVMAITGCSPYLL